MLVYLITNLINKKRYIGQTSQSLQARWGNHVNNAKRGGGCPALMRAMCKYGEQAFSREILFESDIHETINLYEMAYIKFFGTRSPKNGYNLSAGGSNGAKGCKWTEESRSKLSKSCMGNKRGAGKICSEEKKSKISKSLLGHPVSEETKAKIRAARAKQVITPGYKWSNEARIRLSASLKGKRNSPGTEFKPGLIPWNKRKTIAA